MPAHHDLGYRLLFAHPELVRELIAGFTSFTLLDDVALSAFERVNPAYISERLSAREDDIVWRVRLGEHWLYVYILLEFQSGVDRWMALRMQVYVGLLYQDLVKRHELSPRLLLPPVLPIVLYNGKAPWSAAMDLTGLVMEAPGELTAFQAAQRYVLVDQRRLDRGALEANKTLLALLFRLELCAAPDVLAKVLPALATWFQGTSQASLRHSIALWVDRLLKRRGGTPALFNIGSLAEVHAMQREFETWAEEFEDIGFQKGIARVREAKAEGMAEGVVEGQLIALRGALKSVVSKRFGAVPGIVAQRIEGASYAELARWIERCVDAPTLAAVFGDGAAQA